MKKVFAILILATLSFAVQAKLQPKDIVGKWKYTVDAGEEQFTGFFKFEMKEDKITGAIHSDQGTVIPFTKVELGKDDMLKLECKIDYDLIKIDLKVNGKKFSGTGSSYNGEAPVYGEKKE